MKPFKKILVPVDFSACSTEAVRVAVDLSRRYDAKLTLVHVFEPILYTTPEGYPFLVPGQVESLLALYAQALDRARQEAEACGATGVEVRKLQGYPPTEIVDFARKESFDLIVAGTHGRTGIKHALLGSVAEKILRAAPCPVLAVRAEQPAT